MAPSSTIQLPSGFGDNIMAFASAQFGSLSPFVVMIVGVLLAVLVMEILIHALKPK